MCVWTKRDDHISLLLTCLQVLQFEAPLPDMLHRIASFEGYQSSQCKSFDYLLTLYSSSGFEQDFYEKFAAVHCGKLSLPE